MADNQDKLKEISAKLEAGVLEIYTSGKYAEYLRTVSKFPRYSFRNTLLIYLQNPDATRVAGFSTWKELGRSINKGEKGLQILAPSPYKKTIEVTHDKDGNELPEPEKKQITVTAFKPVFVFDVSQTNGKELPTLTQRLTGEVEEYEALLKCLRELSPYPIVFEEMEGSTNGYCSHSKQVIAIRTGLSQQQTIKTGIHELAHALLEHRIGEIARDTAEVQAESVAFITCEHFGIDSSQYTFGYLASWSAGKETTELQKSLDTIQKTATEIIAGIEDKLESIRDLTTELHSEKTAALEPIEKVEPNEPSTEKNQKATKQALLQEYKDQIPEQAMGNEPIVIKRFDYEITYKAEIKLNGKTELCPIKLDNDKYYAETTLTPTGRVELNQMQTELFRGWKNKLLDKQAQIFKTPGLSIRDKVSAAQAVTLSHNKNQLNKEKVR